MSRRQQTAVLRALMTMLCAIAITMVAVSTAGAQGPAPEGLRLTGFANSVQASWSAPPGRAPSGFRVRWRSTTQFAAHWSHVVILPGDARSYTITGLRPGTYEVHMRLLLAGGVAGLASGQATALGSSGEEPPPEEEATEQPEEPEELEEAPVEEEASSSATVPAAPTGPVMPAGGWSVVYGDAFAEPLGTGVGHDNTLFPNSCESSPTCPGYNSDELETFSASQQSTGPEGLSLTCTYTGSGAKPYTCGAVHSSNASGYRGFTWAAGSGQTLVFQAVSEFPPNTGEADVTWWADGPPYNGTEFDFYEAENLHDEGWCSGSALYSAWFATPHPNKADYGFGCSFDPTTAYHTYTTEIFPDGSYSSWIDGVQWADEVGPAKPLTEAADGLTLSYGIRDEGLLGFKSGSRTYHVKSIEVWEDTPHRGVGIHDEGLAPGTRLGS
jgi:Fibronectin type III domain